MDIQKIKELALANGFSLKPQASGNMDLNAYVYDFANAIEQEAKAQAVPEGFVLVPKDRLAKAVDGIEALFEEDCTLALGQLLPIQQDLNAMIEAQGPAND